MSRPDVTRVRVNDSLAALVTIIRAARLTGYVEMERVAQCKLWERYHVCLSFDPPDDSDTLTTTCCDRILELLANGPMQKNQFTDHINRTGDQIEADLCKLEALGLVKVHKEKRQGPGRPAYVWTLIRQDYDGLTG